MKHINKLFIVLAVFFISSCSLTELDLLDNPNAVTPENAETGLFFNSIQLDVKDFFMNVNDQGAYVSRQLAMTGGNVYENAFAATTFNFMWNTAYADLLPDLDQLIVLTEAEGSLVPHYAGAAKILKGYVLMTLVDMFGDVPYSQAGQGVSNPSPTADSQADIYNAALALIDAGISDMGKDSPSIGGTDLFYGGDAGNWIKFANTLKVKWYLNVGSGSNGNGSDIAAAGAGAITTADADFQFPFSSMRDIPDSRHWWYQDGYENGAGYYQSNYFMWSLAEEKGIVDPRIRYYFYRQDLSPVSEIDAFTLDCGQLTAPLHYGNDQPFCHVGNGYWGRDHGNDDGIPPDDTRRSVAGVYPAGGLFDTDQGASSANAGTDGGLGAGIAPIMLSSFTHFMLAEAAVTRNTGGDAAALLEEGVRQSIAKVMNFGSDQAAGTGLEPTAEEVDAYVANVMNSYAAAGSDDEKLNIIMKEYHIALWGNGLEAYNGYRRTTFPSNLQPTLQPTSGDFPRLMYYPADYLNLNANISSQRALTDQAFWDTNGAGVIK
ncbi:MAG: SusD/RagB family nutrient-binding outer membrane lipoprotein [Saprospiraceae bacterium]|nr:SusD/RagB family nutrient-binding outer membrane lipoprotein [Saprospiraceae bacterium]